MGANLDVVQIDISAITAITGVIRFVLAGNANALVAQGSGIVIAGAGNATDLGGTVAANFLEVSGGNIIAGTLETWLEIGGTGALTTATATTAGDAILVYSDNGADSALFLVVFTEDIAVDTVVPSGDLIAVKLLTLDEANSEDADDTNFAFIN